MKKTNLLSMVRRELLLLTILTIGVAQVWADTTGEQTSFTDTSGNVNSNTDITYSCIKAGGTSAPAVNSSEIRLYQNSNATYCGGVIRIYAGTGCTITSVKIGSSLGTTIGYRTDEVNYSEKRSTYTGPYSITANSTYTITSLSTDVISIACFGTTSGTRLYINKLEVTYTKAASTYTVTYNGNGKTSGSVPTDATAYNSGATVTVKSNSGNLAKDCYTFNGWNTADDGSGSHYAAGSGTFTISANTTLYAEWTPIQYTVTWVSNGSTARTDNNVNCGSTRTAPTVSPLPCGDKLVGWTDADGGAYVHGTSTLYSGATPSITITANKTFYAVFADYAD